MESRCFGDNGFGVRMHLFAFREGFPIQFIECTRVCFQSVIHYGNEFSMNLILMDLQRLLLNMPFSAHTRLVRSNSATEGFELPR
jgi:hypothetical protein